MKKYKGKAVLVVNVASQCGFTPQYVGLAELYNKYKNKGLVILGFPCNQVCLARPSKVCLGAANTRSYNQLSVSVSVTVNTVHSKLN
jgi:glutathione peroxidase-family protein